MGPKFKKRPKPILSLDLSNCETATTANTSLDFNTNDYCDNCLVKQPPTKILENLYVGAQTDVNEKFLKENEISAVLTIQSQNIQPSDHITQLVQELKFISIPDLVSADISQHFEETIDFIDRQKKTLVHCAYGKSRSVTICIAYLMKRHRKSFSDAFQYVRHKRPIAEPNFSFLGQLLKYEKLINTENLSSTGDSGLGNDL